MDYFIFLELTPEYVFPPFCGLGCRCMFSASPRVPFPFSFTYFPSSISPIPPPFPLLHRCFLVTYVCFFGFPGGVQIKYCVQFWVHGDSSSRICLHDRIGREG